MTLAGVGDLGDAEVEDLRVGCSAETRDVLRLDVAMDDADFVRRREPFENAARDRDGLDDRKPAASFQARAERLAFEPLHHEVRNVRARHAGVGDGDDVRMLETSERALLVAEPRDDVVSPREIAQEGLEHEALAELEVLDVVDEAHAASAEKPDHPVSSTGNDFTRAEFACSHASRPRSPLPGGKPRCGTQTIDAWCLRRDAPSGAASRVVGSAERRSSCVSAPC